MSGEKGPNPVRNNKTCPYTAKAYDKAVKKVGTKQYLIAEELDIDRKTLRKWGRPDD